MKKKIVFYLHAEPSLYETILKKTLFSKYLQTRTHGRHN